MLLLLMLLFRGSERASVDVVVVDVVVQGGAREPVLMLLLLMLLFRGSERASVDVVVVDVVVVQREAREPVLMLLLLFRGKRESRC